jgi:hypothetical protein
MTQLSGQDASVLYIENDSIKSHFSVLTLYDQSTLKTPLRYRDILAYFDERVSGMPIFRRKLYPVPMDLDAPYSVLPKQGRSSAPPDGQSGAGDAHRCVGVHDRHGQLRAR